MYVLYSCTVASSKQTSAGRASHFSIRKKKERVLRLPEMTNLALFGLNVRSLSPDRRAIISNNISDNTYIQAPLRKNLAVVCTVYFPYVNPRL